MAVVPTSVGRLSVAVQGEPDRPSAVPWPSLFTDGGMWPHQITALMDAGYRTVTIDPPGQGRSEPPERPFSMDACAAAVIAILDATGVPSLRRYSYRALA
jgi:3-oxoadipate enol-lactonase